MTAHELARLLLDGPDLPVKLMQPEYWEGFAHYEDVRCAEAHNDDGDFVLIHCS